MMNLKNSLIVGFGLGLALAGTACSSDSGGSSKPGAAFDAGTAPDRNNVTPGQLCQRLAEIQCAGEAYCCTDPGRTVDECVTAQKNACTTGLLDFDAVASNPITGFDATRAAAAFTTFESKASQCDTSIAAFAADPSGLRGIVQGTIAAGGTCNPAAQTAVGIAAALASCLGPASQACLPASTGDWKCTALAVAGGACYTDINCQAGLYCDNPNLNLSGSTCAPRKADGATCKLPNECSSLMCKSGTCAPKTTQNAYCLK